MQFVSYLPVRRYAGPVRSTAGTHAHLASSSLPRHAHTHTHERNTIGERQTERTGRASHSHYISTVAVRRRPLVRLHSDGRSLCSVDKDISNWRGSNTSNRSNSEKGLEWPCPSAASMLPSRQHPAVFPSAAGPLLLILIASNAFSFYSPLQQLFAHRLALHYPARPVLSCPVLLFFPSLLLAFLLFGA